MSANPQEWPKLNADTERWIMKYLEYRRGVAFPAAMVHRRIKRGRVRWQCDVLAQLKPEVHATSLYFPTKDLAVAKAVELQLKGYVSKYVEGRME